MTRRAARVDANQAEIVSAGRKVGIYSILTFRQGDGCPDWFSYNSRNGLWYPIECKMPGKSLTDDEIKVHRECPGTIHVVHSIEEFLKVVGVVSVN